MRKTLAIIMMIAMVFCYMPLTGFADTEVIQTTQSTSNFKDMPNNWSTDALSKAVGNGLLEGFKEKSGTFIKPSDPLTRAQMATIVNRAFGAKGTANLTGVKDVPQKAWYTAEMQKAVKMGTMKLDSKMRPNDPITRQEAFTVLARAFKMADGTMANLEKFSDKEKVSSWAVSSLGALARVGYIQGADGKLNPLSKITRAEFAVVMDNMIKEYINKAGTVTQVHEGNLMINVPDVILKDITVKGDLILGDGIGEGNVTLENVIVKGNLIARGGGVNSIVINGGGVDGKVVIAKVDGQIRVFVNGAQVDVVVIDDGKDDIIVEGTVGTLEITAPDVPVVLNNASVRTIEVNTQGPANLQVGAGSTVANVVVSGNSSGTNLKVDGKVTNVETSAPGTNVQGTGQVSNVTAKEGANNTKVETPNTSISNQGAEGVTAGGGTSVPSGSTATNSNTGGEATVQPTTGGTTGGGGGGGGTAVITPNSELVPTSASGINNNKVYASYKLMFDNTQIELSDSNISTITEKRPDGTTVSLTPDADTLMWFNVMKPVGTYQYTIVSEDGTQYIANFVWNGPEGKEAVKTGSPGVNDGKIYQNYIVNGVDVDPSDSRVYRIKPDGTITSLTVLSDSDNHLNIWFRLTDSSWTQQEGNHNFLIDKDGAWYVATISYVNIAPEFEAIYPAVTSGETTSVVLENNEPFTMSIFAEDLDLYELEIDHSLEGTLPEFSVYADERDPYGGEYTTFAAAGVTVTYSAAEMKWDIDFGTTITGIFVDNDVTFYLVIKDVAGNSWGSMSPTAPDNTFSYDFARAYNGPVTGQITSSDLGVVNGTLDFEGTDDLIIAGNVTGTGNLTTFNGTVSGSINGTITAQINANGIDTMSGVITLSSGAVESGKVIRIIGTFPQTGTSGDFVGEIITGPVPTYVTSMEITCSAVTVAVGETLQLAVNVLPDGASNEVLWSVYVNDLEKGSIDTNGLFRAISAGTVTVIVKASDGSLKDDTIVITVT